MTKDERCRLQYIYCENPRQTAIYVHCGRGMSEQYTITIYIPICDIYNTYLALSVLICARG